MLTCVQQVKEYETLFARSTGQAAEIQKLQATVCVSMTLELYFNWSLLKDVHEIVNLSPC